jgi:hypothetical protein
MNGLLGSCSTTLILILERGGRSPHKILSILSNYRPRWMIELCRESAVRTVERQGPRITFGDVESSMAAFGEDRIVDLANEYGAECPAIHDLIERFTGGPAIFTSRQHLFSYLKTEVLDRFPVDVRGTSDKSPRAIASFLYYIGFIQARFDPTPEDLRRSRGKKANLSLKDQGLAKHILYSERPDLLKTVDPVQIEPAWVVHPLFRQVLRMR